MLDTRKKNKHIFTSFIQGVYSFLMISAHFFEKYLIYALIITINFIYKNAQKEKTKKKKKKRKMKICILT